MKRIASPAPGTLPRLADEFLAVRQHSMALVAPLSAEDCQAQSMPDASPAKWHLAHTTWFFETFVLERFEPRFAPFDAAFREMFNSYYQTVGPRHPRPERGLLTRPGLERIAQYRSSVDRRIAALLAARPADAEIAGLVTLGLHHEQQHQELLLTDVKHLLSRNPLDPAYHERWPIVSVRGESQRWIEYPGGIVRMGCDGPGFAFDNEGPRHEALLRPYALGSRLVTHGDWADFIDDGGYRNPALWLSMGWDWVQAKQAEAPLYWRRDAGTWTTFTLHGRIRIDPHTPVCHVSYFEADAYARWAGARLPTEAEWENAAASLAIECNPGGALHPLPVDRPFAGTPLQMYGDAWQWTSSAYSPYPGYSPAAGAVGEYNGKFMVGQYVLRGGSCVTPGGHVRPSYRNFFPPEAQWQFSGVRLARDR